MRIDMQAALASLRHRSTGYLATATNAATHPFPSLPNSVSPSPEPPQEAMSECEAVMWLRATIEGDLVVAKAACGLVYVDDDWTVQGPGSGRWELAEADDRPQVWQADGQREWVATDRGTEPEEYEELDPAHAAHIVRHDPRDTIARSEADLKLLDMHGPNRYGCCRACDPDSCGCTGSEDYPCATVRTLLSGYRHREGFKPEWVSG